MEPCSVNFYAPQSQLRILQDCVKGANCWFAHNPLHYNGRANVTVCGAIEDINLFNSRWYTLSKPINEIMSKPSAWARLKKATAGLFGKAGYMERA
ncbi:MAG: hypothetical protein RSG77_18295 [Hafnia sp.]